MLYIVHSNKLFLLLAALIIISACTSSIKENKPINRGLKLCTIKGKTLEPDTAAFGPEGFANKLLLWRNKKTLNVYFFDGEEAIKKNVMQIASEWNQYSGIAFKTTEKVLESDIRISFRTDGWWSLIGSEATKYDATYCTLSLDSLFLYDDITIRNVVLHEFGHALGLLHEHQHPGFNIPWNYSKLYEYYKSEYNVDSNWVYKNVVRKYAETNTIYGRVDPKSIMIYAIPEEVTENGFHIDWPTDLSAYDKFFINNIYKNN